jgi:hypothetical protein
MQKPRQGCSLPAVFQAGKHACLAVTPADVTESPTTRHRGRREQYNRLLSMTFHLALGNVTDGLIATGEVRRRSLMRRIKNRLECP